MKRLPKISSKENGQSMVELAVSLVFLLILLAGIVDFGRLAFHYIALRDAAQEGAAYGIINPTHCDQILDRVRAGMVEDTNRFTYQIFVTPGSNSDSDDDFSIPCRNTDGTINSGFANHACEGHGIKITILDDGFPITMPLLGAFVGNEIPLDVSIRDTIIRPSCP